MAPKCCPKCFSNEIDSDGASGESVCTNCGHVLEECAIVSEVQFSEGAGGQSSVVGQFVPENGLAFNSGPGFGGFNKDSRELTLANGRRVIQHLAGLLRLNTNHGEVAHRFFQQVDITIVVYHHDLARPVFNCVIPLTQFRGASNTRQLSQYLMPSLSR